MAAYLVALALVLAAAGAGRAVCSVSGLAPAAAPAVGLATLLVVASFGVRLPGQATTAAVLVALLLLAALAWLLRQGTRPRLDLGATVTAAAAAAFGSLPFAAVGFVGIPGVSVNNDTSVHLLWAEGLRSAEMGRLYPTNPGYPLGPHSLLATLASATGSDMDTALTALVIAIPVLVALLAFEVLRAGASTLLAVPAAVVVSLSYLSAAWYGQSAFKEPTVALLLLGFAVTVGPLLRDPRSTARAGVPAGLLIAALLLVYSYLAIAWIGLAFVVISALTAVHALRPSRARLTATVRRFLPVSLVAVLVAFLGVLSEAGRLVNYATAGGASPTDVGIPAEALGNLAQPLVKTAALGVWPVADWRFPPAGGTFLLDQWTLAALVCVVVGAIYLVARHQPELPGALAAAAGVMVLSAGQQSPYVTAKALVILAPFVTLVLVQALLLRPTARSNRAVGIYGARLTLAAGFLLACGVSSAMVLRWNPVESPAQRDQLAEIRPLLGDGPTLMMVEDDYAGWRLRGAPVAYGGAGFPAPIAATARPSKPSGFGVPTDWDTFDASTLDRFAYAVTTRSPYQSEAPTNFKRIRQTALYDVWKRTGPTSERRILESAGTPAATLDCKTAPGRRLARRAGTATVLARPPVTVADGLPALVPGVAFPVEVKLPRGSWTLSLRYASQVPLRLQLGRQSFAVPANTTRLGAYWPTLRIRSSGTAQPLLVIAERATRLTPGTIASTVSGIVATSDRLERKVSLGAACGRAVDYYTLDGRR